MKNYVKLILLIAMLTQLQAQNILGETVERLGRSLERDRRELTEETKGIPQQKGEEQKGEEQKGE